MENQQLQVQDVPAELEAEAAVLGTIFLEPNTFTTVFASLGASDFYEPKNRIVFRGMMELNEAGLTIDITTLVSHLTNNNVIEQAGGMTYISSIATKGYTTDNIDVYVELVANAAIRRQVIQKLDDLRQDGYNTKIDTSEYLDKVENIIFEISKTRKTKSLVHVSNVTKEVMADIERKSSLNQEVIGLDTGYNRLNFYTQGFQAEQLIILAARPSMGKSAFALNLAMNIAAKNKGGKATVAVFSLEMSANLLVERMLSADSSIQAKAIREGRIMQNEWARFNTTCSKISHLNIYFDDQSEVTMASIKSKCRKLQESSGLDFVVIDYLQLIAPDKGTEKASLNEKVSKISRSLKLMARELKIPVLALSQLSRKTDDRKEEVKIPQLSDLRDSGAIEQDADIVMFIYRDEYYRKEKSTKPGIAEVVIAKNRSGSLGTVEFNFRTDIQKFTDYIKDSDSND